MMPSLIILLVLVAATNQLHAAPAGFDHGTPNSLACKGLSPRHNDSTSEPESAAPFEIHIINESVDSITFSIQCKQKDTTDTFKGYMIQAHAVQENGELGSEPVGEFVVADDDEDTQSLFCGYARSSVIQKRTTVDHESKQFTWNPPTGAEKPSAIKFSATVVKSFRVYWVGILSPEVKLNQVR